MENSLPPVVEPDNSSDYLKARFLKQKTPEIYPFTCK